MENARSLRQKVIWNLAGAAGLLLGGGCSPSQETIPAAPEVNQVQPAEEPTTSVFSIESMNQTKDRLCDQPDDEFIRQWVELAQKTGSTHISIATPYDNPDCNADANEYARRWEHAARSVNLHIWWRQMWNESEANYGAEIVPNCNGENAGNCRDYAQMTADQIIQHADMYEPGDRFSITAESSNGIRNVTCFDEVGACTFEPTDGEWNGVSDYNTYLLEATQKAQQAFESIGAENVTVDAGGIGMFPALGWENPNWTCGNLADVPNLTKQQEDRKKTLGDIDPATDKPADLVVLYPETVTQLGRLVIDVYFDPAQTSMAQVMEFINTCYPEEEFPDLKIDIGEWGPTSGNNTPDQITNTLTDLKTGDGRIGGAINIWQGGPAGQESLFTLDGNTLKPTENYTALQNISIGN